MEYFYNLLFYFMIYSFAGWCGEVVFATIRADNRHRMSDPDKGFVAVAVCRLSRTDHCS